MTSKFLTHDELQHIEHTNKILQEHADLVKKVTEESEVYLSTYLPTFTAFLENVRFIRNEFGKEVVHILHSSREISMVTKNTQNIIDFVTAVGKLNQILTPELIEKLNKITK